MAFTIGGFGFVGGGNDLAGKFSDFYYYNASTNTWTATDSYPGGARTNLVAFVINDVAYVGLGGSTAFYKFQAD